MDTPVLLLTGYLGSGKTTLVNRILSNRKGIRFAVIVNDLGEVNIDAALIQKGGVVGSQDDSLVALQNGGICEPEPIARTICSMPRVDPRLRPYGYPRLDCIVTVVDALRMRDEFACGDSLTKQDIGEDDIENLIIQQLEFCNIVLVNKVSEIMPEELERIRRIVRAIQPSARIIECDWAGIELDSILNTGLFSYNQVAASAGWIQSIESVPTDEEEAEAREHEHHHHGQDDDAHDHGHHHPSVTSLRTRICPICLSRRDARSSSRRPASGMPRPPRTSWSSSRPATPASPVTGMNIMATGCRR